MAELKDRSALEATLRFMDERIKPRRCDSDGVSGCWRCQSMYLATRMRDLLAERDASGVMAAPASPWISTDDKLPEPGQHIVKRWKNGATWAGVYSGSAKDSSFDFWLALPPHGVARLDGSQR